MAADGPDGAHARALALISRISFTLTGAAMVACVDQVPAEDPIEPVADAMAADADCDGCTYDETERDGAAIDAEGVDGFADGEVDDMMADLGPDAAPTEVQCPPFAEDQEANLACCEELGWPPDQINCTPWGPPMPPHMVARAPEVS